MNVSACEFNCSIELHNNQKDCKSKWHEKKILNGMKFFFRKMIEKKPLRKVANTYFNR